MAATRLSWRRDFDLPVHPALEFCDLSAEMSAAGASAPSSGQTEGLQTMAEATAAIEHLIATAKAEGRVFYPGPLTFDRRRVVPRLPPPGTAQRMLTAPADVVALEFQRLRVRWATRIKDFLEGRSKPVQEVLTRFDINQRELNEIARRDTFHFVFIDGVEFISATRRDTS